MWFKNLRIYRLSEELPCPIGDLGEKLLESAFQPCSGMEASRMGWVSPMGKNSTLLVHSIGDFHLLGISLFQPLRAIGARTQAGGAGFGSSLSRGGFITAAGGFASPWLLFFELRQQGFQIGGQWRCGRHSDGGWGAGGHEATC